MLRLFICVILAVVPAFTAAAHEPEVSISVDGDYRYIKSNGIPSHETGQFPNAHNPNTIAAQDYNFKVPLHPKMAGSLTKVGGRQLFGVAVDGVPFDPGTAEFWNNDPSSGWNYDALSGGVDLGMDDNHAHVQPSGAYHYHGIPTALAGQAQRHSPLIGYAADGYPVYAVWGFVDPDNKNSRVKQLHSSYHIKEGTRPSGPGGAYDGKFVQDWVYKAGTGDLDECNGRDGVTPEYPEGTYYYVLTQEFPFVPRCLKGGPDPSFVKEHEHTMPGRGQGMQGGMGGPDGEMHGQGQGMRGNGQGMQGPGGPGMQGGHRTPPPEAIDACKDKTDNDACDFTAPVGRLTGHCRTVPEGETACVPDRM